MRSTKKAKSFGSTTAFDTVPDKSHPAWAKGKAKAGTKAKATIALPNPRQTIPVVSFKIDPTFVSLNKDAVDSHLVEKPEPFWHDQTGDLSDLSRVCAVEENVKGKSKTLKPGKLSIGFFSDAQRKKYNQMHPEAAQIKRAGPILRVCTAVNRPVLIPVENFEDALKKAKHAQQCIKAKTKPGQEDMEACAYEAAEIKNKTPRLAVAGAPRRKGRR